MFRTLARRGATRAPHHRPNPVRSAISRSSAASTVLVDSVGHHFLKIPVVSRGKVSHFHTSVPKLDSATGSAGNVENPPFEKLMAANRGEIATRIVRAASELGIKTAGIYAHEGK